MPLTASLLLLADSRLPAGGHAHSGGVEAATVAGRVTDLGGLEGFLGGRLATAGLAAAGLAAAACQHAADTGSGGPPRWAGLAAEAAARTPSPAQRAAALAQGRALLRAGRAAWPRSPVLGPLAAVTEPYHPVVLGALTWVTGGTAADAALLAAMAAITGPASAAIRLLGLDPLGVTSLLAQLDTQVMAVATAAATAAHDGDWASLPAPSSPGLDVLAQRHAAAEVALFES